MDNQFPSRDVFTSIIIIIIGFYSCCRLKVSNSKPSVSSILYIESSMYYFKFKLWVFGDYRHHGEHGIRVKNARTKYILVSLNSELLVFWPIGFRLVSSRPSISLLAFLIFLIRPVIRFKKINLWLTAPKGAPSIN